MPQGEDRTAEEKREFKAMLQAVNLLYLAVHVHILVDLSYLSRFWTQFEAWLSMQTATMHGLCAAEAAKRRCSVQPIYGANSMASSLLLSMWADASPQEAFDLLSQPE